MTSVAVVGGGITGLVAAHTLAANHGDDIDITVLEAGSRLGGKLSTTEIGGLRVDEGADAFLVRETWMSDLCAELGLAGEIVAPATGSAYIWHRGALRPIPRQQLLGVPFDLEALAETGLMTPAGLERARQDLERPDDAPVGDESVGSLVRRRLGDEVFENLTDALLGGINAGSADNLSLRAGTPRLAAAVGADPSLMRSIQKYFAENPPGTGPVFGASVGGMSRIVDALAARLTGMVRLSTPVLEIASAERGYVLRGAEEITADAVVVATPAFAAASLIGALAPSAAAVLEQVGYSSVVVVTLVYEPGDAPAFDGSGFLVPRAEGLLMTACSWASSKWAHLGEDGRTVLRISAGRLGDERAIDLEDGELVAAVADELTWTVNITSSPSAIRVTRWPLSLPQYRPGHGERMAALDERLGVEAPGLVVTGAAHHGLGLPACVHQGRLAARRVEEALGLGVGPQREHRAPPVGSDQRAEEDE